MLQLRHPHRGGARGSRSVEADHQPPGPHGRERRGATGQVHHAALAPVARQLRSRRCDGGPGRSHHPEGAQDAAVGPSQPKGRTRVSRRRRPEAHGVAVERELGAQVGRVPVGRGPGDAGVLQDRFEQPLGCRGGPCHHLPLDVPRAVLGHGDVAHHARLLLADPCVGDVAATHAQTGVDAPAPRRPRAQDEGGVSSSRLGHDEPPTDLHARERDLTHRHDPVGPGDPGDGHPDAVDRPAVQAHVDEPGRRVDHGVADLTSRSDAHPTDGKAGEPVDAHLDRDAVQRGGLGEAHLDPLTHRVGEG